MIYQNVLETFEEFLEALKEDLNKVSQNEKADCIEKLLRLMIYAKLFVSPLDQGNRNFISHQNAYKRMITDLKKCSIWQIEDIWILIAKLRAKHIKEEHFKDVEVVTPGQTKESKDDSQKFIPKNPYLLMLEEICSDMRRCQMSTLTITNFVKFISSAQCEVVPEQIKSSSFAESLEFKKGCEELIENAGVSTPRRIETMPDANTKQINPYGLNGSKDLEAISNTS